MHGATAAIDSGPGTGPTAVLAGRDVGPGAPDRRPSRYVEAGLTDAGRSEPASRHMRGVLALTQLDHGARSWAHGRDRVELDRMLDVLTDGWWHLLSGA